MRTKAIDLAISVLLTSVAFGQAPAEPSVDRVLHFTHTETMQGFQEVATAMRTVAGIRQLSVVSATKALPLRGTADEIALAEWLFNELDKPASGQPLAQQVQNSVKHEYRVPGSGDDVLRVLYLTHTETVQGIQEIVTAIRTIADIQRIFPCSAPKALALRGTADQVALAEWLLNELDKPDTGQPVAQQSQDTATHEFRVPSGSDVVRVFYLTHTETVQGLQEIATAIRTVADIQRVSACSSTKALTLRGTADRIVLAAKLISETDKPNAR